MWRNVGNHVTRAGYAISDTADILRIDRANVTRAIAGQPSLVLQRPPAQRLSTALHLRNAEIFLEGLEISPADPFTR
ncbi:hypothetical protein [Hyphomicrobium sp. DY-1]|uniref:hypothetical protein n=1 Tax=Hyphomicrobium sp. DY-1 TaxID=3075650 RepID=UPI0039C220B9